MLPGSVIAGRGAQQHRYICLGGRCSPGCWPLAPWHHLPPSCGRALAIIRLTHTLYQSVNYSTHTSAQGSSAAWFPSIGVRGVTQMKGFPASDGCSRVRGCAAASKWLHTQSHARQHVRAAHGWSPSVGIDSAQYRLGECLVRLYLKPSVQAQAVQLSSARADCLARPGPGLLWLLGLLTGAVLLPLAS